MTDIDRFPILIDAPARQRNQEDRGEQERNTTEDPVDGAVVTNRLHARHGAAHTERGAQLTQRRRVDARHAQHTVVLAVSASCTPLTAANTRTQVHHEERQKQRRQYNAVIHDIPVQGEDRDRHNPAPQVHDHVEPAAKHAGALNGIQFLLRLLRGATLAGGAQRRTHRGAFCGGAARLINGRARHLKVQFGCLLLLDGHRVGDIHQQAQAQVHHEGNQPHVA